VAAVLEAEGDHLMQAAHTVLPLLSSADAVLQAGRLH